MLWNSLQESSHQLQINCQGEHPTLGLCIFVLSSIRNWGFVSIPHCSYIFLSIRLHQPINCIRMKRRHSSKAKKVTHKGGFYLPFSPSLLMLCNNSYPNTEILTKQIKIHTVPDSLSFQSPECISASKVAPSSLHSPSLQLFERLPQT